MPPLFHVTKDTVSTSLFFSIKGLFSNLPFPSNKLMLIKSRDEGQALLWRGFHPSGVQESSSQPHPCGITSGMGMLTDCLPVQV